MNTLKLISPTLSLEKEYNEMMKEWNASKEEYIPWTLGLYKSSFESYIKTLENHSKGIDIPENYIPHSTFWLVNENGNVLGTSTLRHALTETINNRWTYWLWNQTIRKKKRKRNEDFRIDTLGSKKTWNRKSTYHLQQIKYSFCQNNFKKMEVYSGRKELFQKE